MCFYRDLKLPDKYCSNRVSLDVDLKCPLNYSRPFSAHTSLNIGPQCNPLAARPFDPVIGFKDTNAQHCRGFQLFSTVALVSPD